MDDAEEPDNLCKTEPVLVVLEKQEKKIRRRSSIGGEILSSFLGAETMSPIEIRPVRPKRLVQLKIAPAPPATVTERAKPIRYSFDLGERVETKSCLKPSNAPILVRKGLAPPLKSITQRTAQKVVNKYRNRSSSGATPVAKRVGQLKFDNICTIRVITPRPNYNPDNLEMPHSDDEEESKINPNRERLSTVKLRLTPTSEAQLEEMQEKDVFQFHAEMVFGDRDEASNEHPAEPTATSQLDVATKNQAEEQKELKKKPSRRKSLILGAASPLKSPAKIEKPRFEDEIVDQVSEPKRKNRRSLRLQTVQPISASDSESVELLEAEPSQPKKREPLPEPTLEPQPKRNRRKSQGPLQIVESLQQQEEKEEEEKVVEKPKPNRRKSGIVRIQDAPEEPKDPKPQKIHDFFAPKPKKVSSDVIEIEMDIDIAPKKSTSSATNIRKRRSTRFFLPPTEDLPVPADSEAVAATEDVVTTSPEQIEDQKTLSVDSEVVRKLEDVQESLKVATRPNSKKKNSRKSEIGTSSNDTPKESKKMAPMFLKSPKAPQRVVEKLKESEVSITPSTSNSPSTTAKIFSLFSPKPKPKATSSEMIDLTSPLPTSSSSSSSELTTTPSEQKRIGVKREERWGDFHPETYQYFTKLPLQTSIFEDATENVLEGEQLQSIFESRHLDPDILKIPTTSEGFGFKMTNSEDLDTIFSATCSKLPEKIEGLAGSCPLTIVPSTMQELNEGAEMEREVREWLRKWKRRVRKDAENELKNDKKSKKKSGRRRRDEDDLDSDEDYKLEDEENQLQNPLVLIGPTGVGKTALIRTLARQENMRIISTGPESDRTGSEIKKKLQEAMRSHRVDQQSHRRMTFFTTYTTPIILDKEYTQSLIVFEHVDVFFESLDRHGVSALLESVNEASVPVIFTTETSEWPRFAGQIELRRDPLEVWMHRKEETTWKYVQKLIYSCRDVFIDDSTMKSLSESVHHDLRALLHQANFYSLSPHQPLPLTSRKSISTGFSIDWEKETSRKPKKCPKNSERLYEIYNEYSQFTNVDGFVDLKALNLESTSDRDEDVTLAFEALRGRYSRKEICEDVIPLLIPIDRVEKAKLARSRRHLHHFKTHSDNFPIDGDSLISVVGSWGIEKKKKKF